MTTIVITVACTKVPVAIDSISTAPSYALTKTTTSTNAGNYCVTKELAAEYIRNSVGGEKPFSITAYPSEENALMFVVSFDEGWKIIPGDSRFGLVLAQSDSGSIDLNNIPDNHGFRLWLEDYGEVIQAAQNREIFTEQAEKSARVWEIIGKIQQFRKGDTPDEKESGTRDIWAKINYHSNPVTYDTTAYKAPLIQTKWGQAHPWYVSMPIMNGDTCVTGCVAVAVSQVLFYFHSLQNVPSGLYDVSLSGCIVVPSELDYCKIYSMNRYNFTYNSSKWNSMPLDSTAVNPTGYKNVSDLMLDVGERLGLHYSAYETHLHAVNPNYPFNTSPCKMSGTWAQYAATTYASVKSSLFSNKPVIVSATGNAGGHAWVIDGYVELLETHSGSYEWWPVSMVPSGTAVFGYKDFNELLAQFGNVYPGIQEIDQTQYQENFISMNWGFDGYLDGEYTATNPSDYTWHNFGTHIAVLYDIVPSEFTYN